MTEILPARYSMGCLPRSDGTRLAFSSDMSADGYFYVYTISAEGGEPTRLDDTASAWLQDVAWCAR